jgi:predicted DNA-binding transcriptional regulator YafY
MSQTERIAYLDRRLRERGWVTAGEVASAFEVSARQVKRDIEYLRWRLDAPIAYDGASRRYTYEKPYTRFKFADERRVLFSALVKGWAASPAFQPWVTPEMLGEVEAAVARDYRGVADRIRYEAPSTEPVDLEVFAGLCRALRDGRVLEFEYVNFQGEPSRRRAEAQRLIHYGGVWYLVAFDHLRGGLRTFHLGRVRALAVTSEAVTRRPDDAAWKAEVDAWTSSGFGIFRGGTTWRAMVRLRGAALRLAAAQNWHPDQRDTRGEDAEGKWLDRSVPVVDTRELLGRVLAFGADAEARAPEAFRRQWEDEIRRMAALVDGSTGAG